MAYYDFNGDANDIVGGNNGTVTFATLTTDRFGNANRAYSFVNNWSRAWIQTSSSLLPLTTNFWLSFSRKQTVNGNGNNNRIVAKWNNSEANSYIVYMNSSNQIMITLVNNAGTRINFNTAFSPTLNVYYTYFIVWNWTTIYFYVDWVLNNSTAFSWTWWTNSNNSIIWSYRPNWQDINSETVDNSVIEWVAFFNKALSASEVLALYQLSSQRYLTSLMY